MLKLGICLYSYQWCSSICCHITDKYWRSKVRDRDGWRRLLESAKTLHGL